MGYESDYEIKVEPDVLADAVCAELRESTHYRPYVGIDKIIRLSDAKWYDWDVDLGDASRVFHGAVITATRYGENNGDIERLIAKAGHLTMKAKAIIVFPETPSWAKPSFPGLDDAPAPSFT